MNKRILSFVLTLIMLVALIPAGAINASAAGASVSENAITVLKQLEGYSKKCVNGYSGYGTLCTKSGAHGTADHDTTEKEADAALRGELKDLSAAVNSFASKNGLALSQGQHDALVLFSFENGTAWTTGTGDFQTAVKSGLRGSDFLKAICLWNANTGDDNRRKIEANMYLNGLYSSTAPSRYITVHYMPGDGAQMSESIWQYYDTVENPVPDIVPTKQGHKFMGWYDQEKDGKQVTSLTRGCTLYAYWQAGEPKADGEYVEYEQNVSYDMTASSSIKLYTYEEYDIIGYNRNDEDQKVAMYKKSTGTTYDEVDLVTRIPRGAEVQTSYSKDAKVGTIENGRMYIRYDGKKGWVETSELAKARRYEKTDFSVKGDLYIISEYIDKNNVRWGMVTLCDKLYEDDKKIAEYKIDVETNEVVEQVDLTTQKELKGIEHWIKLGDAKFNDGLNGVTGSTSYSIDVTVTVTNTYVRVRSEDSIYSKELRQATQGEQLRIVNTSSNDGFLWGQIADSNDDGVCEGWVALMYTNYESVKDQGKPVVSYNVIATATVVKPVDGYVNVRSDAGTDNQIVGALPYQSRVDLYEIKYVNGIQWGRYSGGWFCLAYAEVNGIDLDDYNTNSGVLSYAFVGDLVAGITVYKQPSTGAQKVTLLNSFDYTDRTVTNLTADDNGNTWGKIAEGWVRVTDATGHKLDVDLEVAKFYTVVDGVTVRKQPSVSEQRVTNLVKGVEFNVNDIDSEFQVMVIGETIWGYADKVGEEKPNFADSEPTYSGWINLASKYVARGDAPSAETSNKTESTGLMATIVGADKVNVRIHHATYSKILGKIAYGTTVAILDEEDGWYKIDYDVDNNPETDSWVVGTYVEVTKASAGSSSSSTGSSSTGSATVETGKGIVANTYSGVNVRTGAGTGNAMVGKLLPGTVVEILEVKTHGASKWGRVSQGWICMDYVTMITNYEILDALTGGNSAAGSSTSTSEVAIYTGHIANSAGEVKIHKTTSQDSDVVRKVNAGDPITLHEILTVTTQQESEPIAQADGSYKTEIITTITYWARVNDGYIYNPMGCITLDALDEATYTVTESDTLNVRSGAGTDATRIYVLKKGDQVTVTNLQIINGTVWGFIEGDAAKIGAVDEEGQPYFEMSWSGEGWISLAYCTKGAVNLQTQNNNTNSNTNTNGTTNQQPVIGAGSSTGGYVTNTSGYRYTGKVINTNSVNVRSTPSTTASVTTTLSSGAALVIYETTTAENMAWGRCDAGWVYLYYVDLTPCTNGAVDARVVYNDNTIVYSDMNCSSVAGTYAKMSVIDIYEIVGKMARTEMGWVNTDNLL